MKKAVFLDRDGTVNLGIPQIERVDSPDKLQLFPDTIAALTELAKLDYEVFFVTNQAGIAEGLLTMQQFSDINDKLLEMLAPSGIRITKIYVCPHGEHADCACRKPKPKLLLDAAAEYGLDLSISYMVGDRLTDVQTGINAGTKTILVKTGSQDVESDRATFTATNLLEAIEYISNH